MVHVYIKLTHCLHGNKMVSLKKIVCILLKNVNFGLYFSHQKIACHKQAWAKIRSNICWTWSWLQPVCNFTKVPIHQNHKWYGLNKYYLLPFAIINMRSQVWKGWIIYGIFSIAIFPVEVFKVYGRMWQTNRSIDSSDIIMGLWNISLDPRWR